MKKYIFGLLSFVFLAVLALSGGSLFSASFSASAEGPIEIDSTDKFVDVFSNQSTYNDKSVVIRLKESLDFSKVDISNIYQTKNTFMGTFDGNGKTISNITLTSSTSYYGLIPYAKEATIQNLKIGGDVEVLFTSTEIQEVYAGVILGYGEDVTIKNCELDNAIVVDTSDGTETIYDNITIPVNSNIKFGMLAGKLKGNPNGADLTMPANIVNCVNYYNASFKINKYSNVSVGGLVGAVENCYMLNNMSCGNITYSKDSTLNSNNEFVQYFGGVVGTIDGSGTNIRNNVFVGTINANGFVEGVNEKIGGVFGGALSSSPYPVNINFDYYTQSLLNPSGDNYVEKSDKVCAIESLNKAFLDNIDNFDQSVQAWNFNEVWMLVNSKYHLQNFQTFEYSLNLSLDRGGILEKVLFEKHKDITSLDDGETVYSAEYSQKIDIKLSIKEEYQGFYYINEATAFMLLNNNPYKGDYTLSETIDADNEKIVGYVVTIDAKAATAGKYSFYISQKTYNCEVSISDQAKALSQGGVRVKNEDEDTSGSQGSSISKFEITFAYSREAKDKKIIAEGNDIYSFDHWELFYRDAEGNFTLKQDSFDQDSVNPVKISFGSAPFDREFKLVAFFTDEESIKIDFGKIDNNYIKSITLGGQEYLGEKISIAPSRVVKIEIVTQKNYLLNTEEMSFEITDLYGENKSPYPAMPAQPSTNEAGETSYEFYLDLNYAKDKIKNNELTLKVETNKDTSKNGSKLLWLYITLPVLAAIGIGLAVFFIIRKKNGGGRMGGRSTQKQKSKSYKDYYM